MILFVGGAPALDQIPPCAGSRRLGLLPGFLVIACYLSFTPSSLKCIYASVHQQPTEAGVRTHQTDLPTHRSRRNSKAGGRLRPRMSQVTAAALLSKAGAIAAPGRREVRMVGATRGKQQVGVEWCALKKRPSEEGASKKTRSEEGK